MDFKDIQKGMLKTSDDYSKKYNVKIDEMFSLVKLQEEVGELAQAILIYKKMSRPEKFVSEAESLEEVGNELADVIGMSVIIADRLGINLEESIGKKWVNRKN